MITHKVIDMKDEKKLTSERLQLLLEKYRLLIFHNLALTDTSLLKLAQSIGTPNLLNSDWLNTQMTTPKKLMKMRAMGKQQGRSLTLENGIFEANSQLKLPLYNNSLLSAIPIGYKLLYCPEFSRPNSKGSILICDQQQALLELDATTILGLDNLIIEYCLATNDRELTTEKRHDQWKQTQPLLYDELGAPLLSIAFPFPDDGQAQWKVRIRGWTERESILYLSELSQHFYQKKYCELHHWQANDLVVFNNSKTLQAHQAFASDSDATLRCIQVEGKNPQVFDQPVSMVKFG
jgi:alpha-ketoglutarate-dependent taurine dioxygenase